MDLTVIFIIIVSTVILTIFIGAILFRSFFKKSSVSTLKTKDEIIEILKNEINKTNPTEYLLHQQEIVTNTNAETKNIRENFRIIVEQMTRLTENQKSNDVINEEVFKKVNELSNVMVNHKSRGNFGEFQLSNIMSIYCGESKEIYGMQYTLKNGYIADCILRSPDEKKFLCIDSKFPLDNYNHIIDESNTNESLERYQNLFKLDVKKHINDISKKYITSETEPYAVMFVPSEAIFQYIAAENTELIEYSHHKKVLMVSPTTLIGVVFTIMNLTKDLKRAKNAKKIEKMIVSMMPDIERLETRHNKLSSAIQTVVKYNEEEGTSINKVGTRIRKIHDGYVEETEDIVDVEENELCGIENE